MSCPILKSTLYVVLDTLIRPLWPNTALTLTMRVHLMRERPKPQMAPYRPAMVLVRQNDRQNPIQLNRKATVWRRKKACSYKHRPTDRQTPLSRLTDICWGSPCSVYYKLDVLLHILKRHILRPYECSQRIAKLTYFDLSHLHSYWRKRSCCLQWVWLLPLCGESIENTFNCLLTFSSKQTFVMFLYSDWNGPVRSVKEAIWGGGGGYVHKQIHSLKKASMKMPSFPTLSWSTSLKSSLGGKSSSCLRERGQENNSSISSAEISQ